VTITHKHLTPWLSSVYVPGEFRGRGIASALSLRALAEAARLSFDKAWLRAALSVHAAQREIVCTDWLEGF